MQTCSDQLNDYLIKYEKSGTRYGCTTGLSGGHGSGKTHLLSWLGAKAVARTVSNPIVLYAKADRASFFDLYVQLLAQVKPAELQVTIAAAVKNLAVEEVNKAEVTRSIEKRLQTSDEMQRLFTEQNLDREALFLTLRKRLQVSGAPEEITEALLLVERPALSEKAYTWLSGKHIEDPEALGIPYQLDALPIAGEVTSIPEVVAVNALETLAALFAVAHRPLLVLIDQLEVLLRTDTERKQTLSSVIKKLIEQLGRQNVLIFIAGTPESWSELPRDVAPRLRTRNPMFVGALSPEETRLLLESFSLHKVSSETLTALMRISGGNPREILRIFHYAFDKTSGSLERVSSDDIIECAELAGTLDDRRKLALAAADQAFARIGTALTDVDVGGELPVDRLLQTPSAPTIALITLTAADSVSEAKLARSLVSTTRKLNERWPEVRILIVSLGYSTQSIRQQLGRTATVVEYSEDSFSPTLQGVLAEMIRERELSSGPMTQAVSLAAFRDLTDSIETRLSKIEYQRSQETQRILESFVAKTRILATPERERRELRSRWDILAELDKLEDRIPEGSKEEKEFMRAILVANEASIKSGRLDFLGSMYLDCLTTPYHGMTERFRSELLLEMRRVLRPSAMSKLVFDRPWRAFAILSGVVLLILLFIIQLAPLVFPVFADARRLVRLSAVAAIGLLAYSGLMINMQSNLWRSRWNRRFKEESREQIEPTGAQK